VPKPTRVFIAFVHLFRFKRRHCTRIHGAVIVWTLRYQDFPVLYPLLFTFDDGSTYSYLYVPTQLGFYINSATNVSAPSVNLIYHYGIVLPQGVAYAQAHHLPISTYEEVMKTFSIKQ